MIGYLESEELLHQLVPCVRHIGDGDGAGQELLLELEPQDDVQAVRHLVRVDADEPRPHGIDRVVERILVNAAELLSEDRLQVWIEPSPETARASDEVLPRTALR